MKLKESLTKENFWNKVYKEFPNQTQVFCDWIDEYKKSVHWHKLFAVQVKYNKEGRTDSTVKYHDLPHALQVGIWIEFISQQDKSSVDDIALIFTHGLRIAILTFITNKL